MKICSFIVHLNFFFFFFVVLVLELRAYNWSHSTSPFAVVGVFKIGSCKLLAGVGVEPPFY
jgi:hypothetical protein